MHTENKYVFWFFRAFIIMYKDFVAMDDKY